MQMMEDEDNLCPGCPYTNRRKARGKHRKRDPTCKQCAVPSTACSDQHQIPENGCLFRCHESPAAVKAAVKADREDKIVQTKKSRMARIETRLLVTARARDLKFCGSARTFESICRGELIFQASFTSWIIKMRK